MTSVTVPQYLPGEWLAVVTQDCLALLPTTSAPATVNELWESLRRGDGTPLVEHLQVLTAGGLAALPPFALLQLAGGRLHAVVRGAVEVDVTVAGVTRLLTARHVATWTEEALDDVDAVVVRAPGVAGPMTEAAYPLVAGVVRAGAVRVPLVRDAAAPALRTAIPAAPVARTTPTPVVVAPRAEPAEAVPPVAPVSAMDLVEDTLLRPPADAPAGAPALAEVPAPAVAADDLLADLPPAVDVPAEVVPDVALDDVLADHDGTTVLSPDVVALRNGLPDWAGHALPAPVVVLAPPAAVRLVLSTGDSVILDRPVLLGRAPQVSRVASAQVPRLVTVPSPEQDISRTHAEVRMDGDDVVLTDLRSTNGVLVVRPNAAPQRLQPGEATVLQPGVLVDLGEGVTFTVETGA